MRGGFSYSTEASRARQIPRSEMRAGIYSEDEGHIALVTPYIPDLVAEIKGLPDRRWDPERKVWVIPRPYLEAVVHIVSNYIDDIESDLAEDAPPHADPSWVRTLFEACPEGRRADLFRALAKALHPDSNPGVSSRHMAEVNKVFRAP